MGVKDDIMRELAGVPEPVLRDVLALLRARKRQGSEPALLAEATLAMDWLRAEEDVAWKDL